MTTSWEGSSMLLQIWFYDQ